MLATAPLSRWIPLAAFVWIAAFPTAVLSITIADVAPLFFDGVGGYGTSAPTAASAGESPAYVATPYDAWLSAGASGSHPLAIQQTLTTVHQNPSTPSGANPVIADSSWRIENLTAGYLIDPLLVFTIVDPSGLYPAALPLLGLDANLVDLVAYSSGGVDYLFGAMRLPSLGNGDFADITVRYVATGPLAGGEILPALGVSVLGSYTFVPEPTTALLVLVGLGLTAASRRRF